MANFSGFDIESISKIAVDERDYDCRHNQWVERAAAEPPFVTYFAEKTGHTKKNIKDESSAKELKSSPLAIVVNYSRE